MKYQQIRGTQLYVPESNFEAALVRSVLQVMLHRMLGRNALRLNFWDRLESRDGAWFGASCALPSHKGGEETVSRSGLLEGISNWPLLVAVMQIALPVDFEESQNVVVRRHPDMTTEARHWLIHLLDVRVYGSDAEPFTEQHFHDARMLDYLLMLWDRENLDKEAARLPRRLARHVQGKFKPLRKPSPPGPHAEAIPIGPHSLEIAPDQEFDDAAPDVTAIAADGPLDAHPPAPQTETDTASSRRARRRKRGKRRRR